jgi:hypothetical protein
VQEGETVHGLQQPLHAVLEFGRQKGIDPVR